MQPLRIDCRLAGPWCPPAFGLHLDGLLSWVLVEDAKLANARASDYQDIIADLPLEKHPLAGGASSVWCSSVFCPVDWLCQERRYLSCRINEQEMALWIDSSVVEAKGGSRIDTVRGIAKASQSYFTIEHARGLRAWCIGDPDAVLDLLSRVPAVGIKTRIGFGTLLPYEDGALWRVTPDEAAGEMWRRRSSPEKLQPDSYQAVGSWRSPYWRGHDPIWRPAPLRLTEAVAQPA